MVPGTGTYDARASLLTIEVCDDDYALCATANDSRPLASTSPVDRPVAPPAAFLLSPQRTQALSRCGVSRMVRSPRQPSRGVARGGWR